MRQIVGPVTRGECDSLVYVGAWLLDHSVWRPCLTGWRQRIDVPALDMSREGRCVLGQLFGAYHAAPYFLRWKVPCFGGPAFGWWTGDAERAHHGRATLGEAWAEYLAEVTR